MIFHQKGVVLCLRKRKPNDVSTSVLSVEVTEIQTRVGESSFWLRVRPALNFSK